MPIDWTQIILSAITLAGVMFTGVLSAFVAYKVREAEAKRISEFNWKNARQAMTDEKLSEVGHAINKVQEQTNGTLQRAEQLLEEARVAAKKVLEEAAEKAKIVVQETADKALDKMTDKITRLP